MIYSMVYLMLRYCILVWGITSAYKLQEDYHLQKKMRRILENYSGNVYRTCLPNCFSQNTEYSKLIRFDFQQRQRVHKEKLYDIKSCDEMHACTFRHTLRRLAQIRTNYRKQPKDYQMTPILNFIGRPCVALRHCVYHFNTRHNIFLIHKYFFYCTNYLSGFAILLQLYPNLFSGHSGLR